MAESIHESIQKAKNWTGILYVEHLTQYDTSADLLGALETLTGFVSPLHVPGGADYPTLAEAWSTELHFAVLGERHASAKPHLHICLTYSGRTTEHHMHSLLCQALSIDFAQIPLMQPVQNVESLWDYFTHSTEAAKDKQQFAYGNTTFGGFQREGSQLGIAMSLVRKIYDLHLSTLRGIIMSTEVTDDEKKFVISHPYFVKNL